MCDWVGSPLAFSCGACYYFNEPSGKYHLTTKCCVENTPEQDNRKESDTPRGRKEVSNEI